MTRVNLLTTDVDVVMSHVSSPSMLAAFSRKTQTSAHSHKCHCLIQCVIQCVIDCVRLSVIESALFHTVIPYLMQSVTVISIYIYMYIDIWLMFHESLSFL